MKKIFLLALIFVGLLLCLNSRAQTFGGGIPVTTGNTNAQLQSNGAYVTNTVFGQIPTKTLTLSGIANTNEAVWGYYAFRIDPALYPLAPGTTNVYIISLFTNNFAQGGATGTNGGVWITNFAPLNINALSPTIIGLTICSLTNYNTTFSNSAYMP